MFIILWGVLCLMNKKFKRSILGYKPISVQKELDRLKQEFEKEIEGIESQLICISNDNKILKQNIQLIKDKIENQKSYEAEITQILLKAHIEASQKLYGVIEKIKDKEKDKIEILMIDENKHNNIKSNFKKLMDEMQFIIEE